MRRIRYAVASSLDGFIAGPSGEADWIVMDAEIDFNSLFQEFDTVLMGRRSFTAAGGKPWGYGMQTIVISRTLRQHDHPDVTIVAGGLKRTLTRLKEQPGKDIWLFGGGLLFRSLLELGLVDTVEVAVMPVLLGAGIPLLPTSSTRARLKLTGHKVYKSGIVGLEYSIQPARPAAGRRQSPRAAAKKKSRSAALRSKSKR